MSYVSDEDLLCACSLTTLNFDILSNIRKEVGEYGGKLFTKRPG